MNNVIPADINNCGGLLHTMRLAKRSRLMLSHTILISDGLVNSAMGVVEEFKWPEMRRDKLGAGELLESVLIKFDYYTTRAPTKTFNGSVAFNKLNVSSYDIPSN